MNSDLIRIILSYLIYKVHLKALFEISVFTILKEFLGRWLADSNDQLS